MKGMVNLVEKNKCEFILTNNNILLYLQREYSQNNRLKL